ncbi:MAG: hypothetical protein ACYC6M_02185 [Terriglobales bacterium]
MLRPFPSPIRRRVLAGTLSIVVGLGLALTVCTAAADWEAGLAHYDWAVRWRPDIAAYHRRFGEMILMDNPELAREEFLRAQQLDPNDVLTRADLSAVEMGTDRNAPAFSRNASGSSINPLFYSHWRYANMVLTRGDLEGFWRETAIAGRLVKEADVFPSIIVRALSASGDDFKRLYQVLPRESALAAEAFCNAAWEKQRSDQIQRGLSWLTSLPSPPNPEDRKARTAIVAHFLLYQLQNEPENVAATWAEGVHAGLLKGALPMTPDNQIVDGEFPAGSVVSLLHPNSSTHDAPFAWTAGSEENLGIQTVATHDATWPTALSLQLDGDEGDSLLLAQQWLLAHPGQRYRLEGVAREQFADPAQGLQLWLSDRFGQVLSRLPLATPVAWAHSQIELTLPLPPNAHHPESYRAALYYVRTLGEAPAQNTFWVARVALVPLPGSEVRR